jgi:hypothetical protein
MECATVSCECDDYCTMLAKNYRTARKTHRCTECKRAILAGVKYLDERTVYDGRVETWKTCEDCESIRENFFKEGWYWGDTRHHLIEHIYESFGDVSESCISELSPGARADVCEIISAYWEKYEDDDD